MGKDSSARGYQLQDFVPLWQKHLAFDPASVTRATESQIANNDGRCSAVADSETNSEIRADQRESASEANKIKDPGVAVPKQELAASSQELEAGSSLPPILPPSSSAFYNFGPHSARDVEIIRVFAAQGYKALSEREAHRMEFSCGNLPFGTMIPRTSTEYPAKPVSIGETRGGAHD